MLLQSSWVVVVEGVIACCVGFDAAFFRLIRSSQDLALIHVLSLPYPLCRIADELMQQPHPIWPDRSRQIIKSIVDSDWHKKTGC